jgi:4a-hydroxytetrahydrobiopterin dehydratase
MSKQAAPHAAPAPTGLQPRSLTELASMSVRHTPDDRLQGEYLATMMALLPMWTMAEGSLQRSFSFVDYHGTMAFVNAVAWIAHRGDHHPDLQVGYNRCTVRWSTHSAGGITLKDLICASQVEALQCPQA